VEKDNETASMKTKKAVLTGPESTGKTVLSERLADHFNTIWVPEYLREFFDLHNGVKQADVYWIAKEQLRREELAMKDANRILICDTDLLTSVVYHRIYFGKTECWMNKWMKERKPDLYILLDVDVPWVPDPQRDQPHRREELLQRFKDELNYWKLPYHVISGNYEERFHRSVALLQGLLKLK
jgi:NadR type nicotinamide-nucleotide adenylyltransferase